VSEHTFPQTLQLSGFFSLTRHAQAASRENSAARAVVFTTIHNYFAEDTSALVYRRCGRS
jgi:hypothetical protein